MLHPAIWKRTLSGTCRSGTGGSSSGAVEADFVFLLLKEHDFSQEDLTEGFVKEVEADDRAYFFRFWNDF